MEIIEKKYCTGCMACMNICPCGAITYVEENGFKYPVIDSEKCIDCKKCKIVCPVSKKGLKSGDVKNVYALKSKNDEIRFRSTSGGAFSEIAQLILEQGGCIVGAAYRKDWTVSHKLVESVHDLEQLRRSKYQQSDMGHIYIDVKEKLLENRKVLFCGTPCQVAALKSYLQKDYKGLYTCDFICRGVSSPLLFKAYINDLEKQYSSKAIDVWLKNKKNGWHSLSTVVVFENGKIYEKRGCEDSYCQLYLKYSVGVRSSCYTCQFKEKNSKADITLGDFWGLNTTELDDDKGISVFIARTDKGIEIVQKLSKNCDIVVKSLEDVERGNPCLDHSIKESVIDNKDFFDVFNDSGYKSVLEYVRNRDVE